MRGNYEIIDEAISGVRYYFMRLPRSLRLLAMTIMVTFILSTSSLSL
ncbi:RND transporter [Rickettsia hoogstraalii]|nr:RND transporter [Rickettsia hoogstraalii]